MRKAFNKSNINVRSTFHIECVLRIELSDLRIDFNPMTDPRDGLALLGGEGGEEGSGGAEQDPAHGAAGKLGEEIPA